MSALAIAIAALALSVLVWVTYLSSIPRGKVPAAPVGSVVAQLASVGLAVAAMVLQRGGAVISASALALVLSLLFLFILSQRKTPVGAIRVAVGDSLPAFKALRPDGSSFDSGEFRGHRILLKFFRGSW
jgi:hypothetical protein